MRIDLQGIISILCTLSNQEWNYFGNQKHFSLAIWRAAFRYELPEIKAFICTSRQNMWVSTGCHIELRETNGTIKTFKVSLQMAELLFLHVKPQHPTWGWRYFVCVWKFKRNIEDSKNSIQLCWQPIFLEWYLEV